MSKKKVKLKVVGAPGDYWAWTLYMWVVEEVKPLLEDEFCVEVEVERVEKEGVDVPRLYLNDVLVLEGVLSEGGYVYELVRSKMLELGYEVC